MMPLARDHEGGLRGKGGVETSCEQTLGCERLRSTSSSRIEAMERELFRQNARKKNRLGKHAGRDGPCFNICVVVCLSGLGRVQGTKNETWHGEVEEGGREKPTRSIRLLGPTLTAPCSIASSHLQNLEDSR
jgi:hypothetical protein